MRLWLNTLLRLIVGTYFVLTSLYCVLAFLPYTYFFLVKAPAYAWMPWFAHHQALLFWAAALCMVAANWHQDLWNSGLWRHKDRKFLTGIILLAAAGIYLSLHPFLPALEDNRAAYVWSLAALLPLLVASLWKPSARPELELVSANDRPFAYSSAFLVAVLVSAVYFAGATIHSYLENRLLSFHKAEFEFTLWTLLSHIVVATLVLSVLNLIFIVAARTPKTKLVRRTAIGMAIGSALATALYRFLESALSFRGWEACLYSVSLGFVLALWGFWLVTPFLDRVEGRQNAARFYPVLAEIVLVAAAILAITFPYLIGGADWSGFLEGVVTIAIWIAVSACLFRLRPRRAQYSALTVLAVFLVSAVAYKTLEASAIFWSRPLGATDDEISLALETYGGHDASFQLARSILGGSRNEVCGDLCHILREYTNIRDTHARVDVKLVDQLAPSPTPAPNIFIFVIDSMRPDYLGAYNSRASYTPNLDALARDSIVFHRAFTQYAGTSLSEPAIWSGAMMLHAHYLQPFSRLNSLDRLIHADHYRTIVSMDEVLRVILPGDGVDVKLDTDKKLWNQFELGDTIRQAETAISAPADRTRPIFFYAQPKNVHQFARNDVPSPTSQHWQSPAGMNARITYEVHWVDSCMGEFFRFLKQQGLYDNSIIIVTSDHGDATGEFGRTSHSTSIWPEIMHVPLIMHLPVKIREHLVYDDSRISTLTDITPTLYHLLGEGPILENPLYGRPLVARTRQELDHYPPKDLLLASDARAVYGILTADGHYLYTTYDSPEQSYLFDLENDPNAERNILTPVLKQRYDEQIIEHLQQVGDFYNYKPGVGSLLASTH